MLHVFKIFLALEIKKSTLTYRKSMVGERKIHPEIPVCLSETLFSGEE